MKLRVLETALYVADLDASEKFYRDLFGCETLLSDERMRALNINDTNVLLLFKRGGTTQGEEVEGGFIPPHDASGQIHLCFAIEKDDLDNWHRVLDSCNVEIISTVFPPRGGTSLYFRDLDDHLIELATPGIWPMYRGCAAKKFTLTTRLTRASPNETGCHKNGPMFEGRRKGE